MFILFGLLSTFITLLVDYLLFAFTGLSFHGVNTGSAINMGKGYNKTSFILNSLGFVIGGLAMGLIVLGDKVYCNDCKKLMEQRHLYSFTISEWDLELNGLSEALISKESFDKYVDFEHYMGETLEPYIKVALLYCPICKYGFIKFKYMESQKSSNGYVEYKEKSNNNRRLELNSETVLLII